MADEDDLRIPVVGHREYSTDVRSIRVPISLSRLAKDALLYGQPEDIMIKAHFAYDDLVLFSKCLTLDTFSDIATQYTKKELERVGAVADFLQCDSISNMIDLTLVAKRTLDKYVHEIDHDIEFVSIANTPMYKECIMKSVLQSIKGKGVNEIGVTLESVKTILLNNTSKFSADDKKNVLGALAKTLNIPLEMLLKNELTDHDMQIICPLLETVWKYASIHWNLNDFIASVKMTQKDRVTFNRLKKIPKTACFLNTKRKKTFDDSSDSSD